MGERSSSAVSRACVFERRVFGVGDGEGVGDGGREREKEGGLLTLYILPS